MARGFTITALVTACLASASGFQEQAPNRRDVTIVAKDHQFHPNRIEVSQDDLVRVTLKSDDRPYSFAIDAYRIMKRAAGGQAIVFEFRADRAGSFTFYCSLTADPQCAEMKGVLVVAPRELIRVVGKQPIDSKGVKEILHLRSHIGVAAGR